MKTKFLQFALVAFAALTFTSCSNDNDADNNNNNTQEPNTVTIDGKTESITDFEGGIMEKFIYIGLSTYKDKYKDEYQAGDSYGSYEFEIPLDRIGEKINLEKNDNDNPFYSIYLFGWSLDNGYINFGLIASSRSDNYQEKELIGTNNWLRLTKSSKLENTYTVEFEMNLEGKIIKGNYTEVFNVYSN